MDTNNAVRPAVEAGKPSRLPAGSTLVVAPGVHVPHPHAEVNLPGAGDPRIGDTDAVTESVKLEPDGDGVKVTIEQKPLADEVKPKVLTVAPGAKVINEHVVAAVATGAASESEDKKLAVDDAAANVSHQS